MTCLSAQEAELIALTNLYRGQHGLRPLRASQILTDSARAWATFMADEDHFSHTGQDGSSHQDRARRLGYPATASVGANILYGQPGAAACFKAWRNSPAHNENLLSPRYTEIGVALAVEPRWDWAGDVYLAASMELGTGSTGWAPTCGESHPPMTPPTRPIDRPPVTHLPVAGPDRAERREQRQQERGIRRLLRRLGGR